MRSTSSTAGAAAGMGLTARVGQHRCWAHNWMCGADCEDAAKRWGSRQEGAAHWTVAGPAIAGPAVVAGPSLAVVISSDAISQSFSHSAMQQDMTAWTCSWAEQHAGGWPARAHPARCCPCRLQLLLRTQHLSNLVSVVPLLQLRLLSRSLHVLQQLLTMCRLCCLCCVPQAENKFKCPCHGSQYDSTGKKIRGPAPLVSGELIRLEL